MDTNMEDVGKLPEAARTPATEPASIPTLDGWIESLMTCKQLAEVDVQKLCEKVRRHEIPICYCDVSRSLGSTPVSWVLTECWNRHEKFYKMNQTYNQWYVSK